MLFSGPLNQRMPRWLSAIGALPLYLLLAILVFASAWTSPAALAVGTGPDPQLSIWFLRWTPFALSHGQNPFVTDYINFPQGANLMWNTFFPLAGLLLWPVTTLFGPVVAYNLLATLALALSAWCAYLAIHCLVRSPLAAAAGGLLYGFSPYMVSQSLGHPQLTMAFFPPLLLLLVHEILVRRQRSAAVTGPLLGLLAAAQLLIGEEVLATATITALLGILLLIALNPHSVRTHVPHAVRSLSVAAGVFLLVTAFPLSIQFFGPQRPHGPVQVQDVFVTDLLGFFVPTRLQLLSPSWAVHLSDHFSGNPADWNAYLGLPLILLLVFSAVRFGRSQLVRATIQLCLLLVLLSMGRIVHVAGQTVPLAVPLLSLLFVPMNKVLPFRWTVGLFLSAWIALAVTPILDNVLPDRLMLYVFLLAGILLAVFLDWVLEPPNRKRLILGGIVTAIALAPLVPRLPFPSVAVAAPPFFTASDVTRIPDGSVALVVPSYQGYATAMLWQAHSDMRFRMPEGYAIALDAASSRPLATTETLMANVQLDTGLPPVTAELRQDVLWELSHSKVSTIIVGPMPHQDQMIGLVTSLLGRYPNVVGGVFVWWDMAS